jgi:hypothetical protein
MKLILTCGTPLLVAAPTEGCKLPLEDYWGSQGRMLSLPSLFLSSKADVASTQI